jgi:signal peptide peptidase SppA
MRLAALLATLQEEPLLITPSYHAVLLRLLNEHASLDPAQFRAAREGENLSGDKIEIPQAELIDGITYIPIGGPIGVGLGKFEKGAGCVDCDDLTDELESAEENDQCQAILFDIDSPGGMFQGTPELADRIAQCPKTTGAFTAGMECSAAIWLASSCDYSFASKSADIGSIGVYCYLLDTSERYAAQGLKPEVIASGKYKGMGAPGIPLSADQRQHLQDRINESAEMFYQHIERMRPGVSREDMQGQTFKAETAVARGLIDYVVPNLAAAAALLRKDCWIGGLLD